MVTKFCGCVGIAAAFYLISQILFDFLFTKKVSELSGGYGVVFLIFNLVTAFYCVRQAEKLGKNRLSQRENGTFLKHYSDKIFPGVAASLLTAGVIWLFENPERLKALIDAFLTNP